MLASPHFERLARRVLAVAGALGLSVLQSPAEVVVQGRAGDVRVQISDDTLGHVLEVLRRDGHLTYRLMTPMTKTLAGPYSGALDQVLPRILAGFDYVAVHRSRRIDVIVYGESGAKAMAPPEPSPTSPPRVLDVVQGHNAARAGGTVAPRHPTPGGPSAYDKKTSNLGS